MEEKKSNVVEMNNSDKKKLSYEELNNAAIQLSCQLENAKKQLAALSMSSLFKRLDYLFKVVELSSSFDSEFVSSCTSEIKNLMTLPEEDNKE